MKCSWREAGRDLGVLVGLNRTSFSTQGRHLVKKETSCLEGTGCGKAGKNLGPRLYSVARKIREAMRDGPGERQENPLA